MRYIALAFLGLVLTPILGVSFAYASDASGIYGFTMTDINGQPQSLAAYRGKVLLIVNTASKCGYTPQYKSLEALYQQYHSLGLEILAFPANNFKGQEPGTNAEIKDFCYLNYKTTFPLFGKISVTGEDIAPLYQYLTTQSRYPGEIPWNFTKFLVAADGQVVARFEPAVDPLAEEVVGKVRQYLNELHPQALEDRPR